MTASLEAEPRTARRVPGPAVAVPARRILYVPLAGARDGDLLTLLAGLGRVVPADERALTEDGWLRFTVVRHPATRVWSAWASRLPAPARVPERPRDLVSDFHRFVAGLEWPSQCELLDPLPLDHVGRVEDLEPTLERLRAHAGRLPALPPADELPPPPDAYTPAGAARLRCRHGADFAAFGYAPTLPATPRAEWDAAARRRLPAIRAARGARRGPARAPRPAPVIANLEGEPGYDVRPPWADGPPPPGLTAILRVKDEARTLPWTLPPLLRAVDRVVLIDNGSTDGTADVARRTAREHGRALDVREYPFAIARCGAEHLSTPARSVHSLTHFYNWSFAHARTAYVLKWDADMALSDDAVAALRDLAWQLEAAERIIRVPRHPLYVVDDRRAFLDLGIRNCEPWGWPNAPGYTFVKSFDWELPLWGGRARPLTLPDLACIELKFLDADEFAHWSTTDFAAAARTQRKRREWEVFSALTAGEAAPDGVVEIVAPPGVPVIRHVRESWLPGSSRPRTPAAA